MQFEIETGAARRLLKIVTSPVLDLRHGDGIDWEEILEKKMQVYFDLSGVKYEAARAIGIAASHAVIDACRLHYERTGESLPVVICYEECGIMEFLTPLAVDFAREHRKAGLSIWACSQTIRDFDEETFEQFLGLADEHHWYFLASGVERAAADLANPTFNPMEVHYTRDRVVTDSYDEVKTVSKGTSRGPDGKTRTDERVGITYRPRTRIVVEEYFKTPQLHEQEFRTWLAQLKTGERYVRDQNGVRKEKVTMLDEPWAMGLTPIRSKKAIERIRRIPSFLSDGLCGVRWKDQRRQLYRRLRLHPCTLEQLLDLFASEHAAKKYLTKAVRKGRIYIVGRLVWDQHKGGRPRNVYACRPIRQDRLRHELAGTLVFLKFAADFERTGKLPYNCDAVMHQGAVYLWEIDMGEEGHSQFWWGKFARYAGCPHLVLVVTTSSEHKNQMMHDAKYADFPVAFTTFEDVLKDPYGPVWNSPTGKVGSLPKPLPKTGIETRV